MYLSTNIIELSSDFQSTTQNFLEIPGYRNYYVDILTSRVINKSTGRILSCLLHRGSCRLYLRCHLGLVHRIIMSAWIGRSLLQGEQVRHLDGNGLNNNIENLRVGTAKSNALDRISSNSAGYKLKNQDVREIRILFVNGWSYERIASRFKVSRGHVYQICRGLRWSNLP